jgi:hypothetical protein
VSCTAFPWAFLVGVNGGAVLGVGLGVAGWGEVVLMDPFWDGEAGGGDGMSHIKQAES